MNSLELPQTVISFANVLPYLLAAFAISLLATPIVARIAQRIGAIDLPKNLREKQEGNGHRINSKITPRLGGLAMMVAMVAVLILDANIGFNSGIWLGLFVLTVVGIADDMTDLPPKTQMIAQLAAALLVVLGGIRIESIQVVGLFQDLHLAEIPITIGQVFSHTFIWPADLITVFWIVALINFVNWVGGVDALNGSVSAVGALAVLLITISTGNLPLAMIVATYLGAVLGVLPFNYHPSKIFYGFGENINGFLLAIFTILASSKTTVAIIILGLPLFDALWVAFTRMRLQWKHSHSPVKLIASTMKSDRNHLHHRLLDLGYSWKLVMFIELIIMAVLSTIAFYIHGLSENLVTLMIIAVGMMILFAIIGVARKKVRQIREYEVSEAAKAPRVEIKIAQPGTNEKIEDKYVY